jgi:hypothetical protein
LFKAADIEETLLKPLRQSRLYASLGKLSNLMRALLVPPPN